MKMIVSRHELAAALLFASTDESRYVLNGVLIEVRRGGKPIVVSTDGKRLVVIETLAEQHADELFSSDHRLLLRADFVKPVVALSKALGVKLFPWICFENSPGSKRVEVSLVGPKVFLDAHDNALIEGEYPNWRQVIPAESADREPVSAIGLNAEYVGDFAKAGKLLEIETPIVQMRMTSTDGAIEVRLHGSAQFYGLIMPCNTEDAEFQPEFLGIVEQFEKPTETSPEPSETKTAEPTPA